MAKSELKAWAIWFDGLISGWKRMIGLVIVIIAMYYLEDSAQHIAAAFGFFMASFGFAAKQMRNKL